MIQYETRRYHRVNTPVTTRHVVYPIASRAVKMVVMLLALKLISWTLPRQFHRSEPAFLDQGPDIPVDSGDAESRDLASRLIEHFGCCQGPVGPLEGATDRASLSGITFHRPSHSFLVLGQVRNIRARPPEPQA
jgi:hypothetical protein